MQLEDFIVCCKKGFDGSMYFGGQVNELAFTQDGQLFLQSTDSGVEVRTNGSP